jgi:multiple sugar transport system permease protein
MREPVWVRWLRRISLTFFAMLVGLPLFVMVVTSLEPLADVDDPFRWLPTRVTLSSYADMWSTVPLGRYVANSAEVAGATTALALLVAVPAGYALARGRLAGRRTFVILLLVTQAAPGLLFLVPLFLVYAKVDEVTGLTLIGSTAGLVLTHLTFAVPFSTWLIATHVEGLPRDLEDAARVDGAAPFRVLVHVVVPGAAPAIAVVGVLTFALSWGEVLFASVLTRGAGLTLPVGLHAYATESNVLWNQLMAAALATSLPVLAAVLAARRFLAPSLTP